MNRTDATRFAFAMAQSLWSSLRDLLPIIFVVGVFQIFVFRQTPDHLVQLLVGTLLVTLGLSLFISGLQLALFPIGENMANDFARKGSVFWLVLFAFSLGFGTTFAEPALIAVGDKAAELKFPEPELLDQSQLNQAQLNQSQLDQTQEDRPQQDNTSSQRSNFSFVLRFTVAVSVGLALVIGVIRIIKGWPIQYLILVGYVLVMFITPFAPIDIVAIAYDSGGVTTSTITVPLTAALGVGLASSIRGRNPVIDGFGLIALASLTPILFVLVMGIVWR